MTTEPAAPTSTGPSPGAVPPAGTAATAAVAPTAPGSARKQALLASAAAGTTVVLWASAFVGIRAAGRALEPGPLALARLLVGSLVLGAIVAVRRDPFPARRDLPGIVACGVLWFGIYNVALNAAERLVDAGTAAMLVGVGPILMALLAGLLLKEGFPRPLMLGMLLSFGGLVVIGLSSSGGNGGSVGWGALLCFAAALAYATAVVIQKPLLARVSALQITFLACTVGAVACLPFAPALVREAGRAHASPVAWAVYLGALPTAVAFTTWAYALARTSAGRLGVTTYLVPPISVLLGWLVLGEVPGWIALVGGVLCLAGVAVSRLRFGRGTG
ncbi:DMT family transporter [Streptacidiphilus carbonis]|uniref:DMT family transporter n=1 Tax=Streptacidiphilus carbonis TaxID=105422 RepID=UPI000A014D41|nr:DMT family transporter [Streptacidiphilus carbonis]